MVLGVSKKRVVFVSSLLAALTTILITTLKFNGFISRAADTDATKTITITKQWVGDTVSNRPSDITVYLNKTSSTLLPGCQSSSTTLCPGGSANTLEAKMKSLAGNGGFNSANTTITAIKKATNAQYEAKKSSLTSTNEVQASGEKTYMWFENGTIYFYSLADNIYLSPNSAGAFRRLSNLTDISGLAHFNTTYVTDMNRMFQDTPVISDISYLSNWDTGNVLDMTYMFGSNFSSGACVSPMNFSNLTPLANWNVSNVTSMDQMFKCNAQLANLTPLTNWDVTNVTNMNQMFNRSGVTSIDPVKDWNVINVEKATSGNKGFVMMFGNTPVISNYSSMPQFTKRPGSWASNGGYTPTAQPSGAVAKPKKTPSADQQTCSGNAWNKSQESIGVWTCTLTVSNDDSVYKVWEDTVTDYDGSADVDNKITVANDVAMITNIRANSDNVMINLRKIVSGDAGDKNKTFSFQVRAYDENGNLVPAYSRTLSLKHNETATVLVFTIPREYSYEITETGTEYTAYNNIINTDDGTDVKAQTAGESTGRITPTESLTVTFTNIKTNSPTKTITITKEWQEDISMDRPNITAYLNKTTANLINGSALNTKMKALANQGATVSTSTQDRNIIAINTATKAQYDAVKNSLTSANEVQDSGSPNKVYAWFDSGIIYFYSEADNIYMHANSNDAFAKLVNVTDITALSKFNTTYVTSMSRMFQDSWKITDLSDLESWDVSNVTAMDYMFSASWASSGYTPMNISDLSPLAGWNTQKVTTMNSMFKCAGAILNLDALSNWNVSNVTNMNQMFNRTGLTSMAGIEGWNVVRVASSNFSQMLANIPSTTPKLPFKNRDGSWDSNGTYTSTGGAISGSAATVTKVPSADQQTCTGNAWNKVDDSEGIWTCTLTVSNDASIYKVWEDPVAGYDESALADNPTEVMSDTATISNIREGYTITYQKIVTGDMADVTQTFDLDIKVYDLNGDELVDYSKTDTLRHNRIRSMVIPAGYSYQITENTNVYDNYYQIVNSNDDSIIVNTTMGSSTGTRTPTNDETITFTNNRTGTPLTGRFFDFLPFSIMISIVVSFSVARTSYLYILRRRRGRET